MENVEGWERKGEKRRERKGKKRARGNFDPTVVLNF